LAQIEDADRITKERLAIWQRYHELLEPLESKGILRRPIVPDGCQHNAHMYYVLLAPEIDRQKLLDEFKRNDIGSVFHYIPLHSSPGGLRYGRTHGSLKLTTNLSERLIRLPLWLGITEDQQDKVVNIFNWQA
jgi:dTDP-4-amino-4,6-dideoxygalactose transaminase